MPVTEDIQPTVRVLEGTGDAQTVTYMYDGNVATEGRIGARFAGQWRRVYLFQFPAGTVHPETRTEVYLRILGMWMSFDSNDTAQVDFSEDGVDFTRVDTQQPVNGWAPNKTSPAWRQWDITALALAYAATGFYVAITFINGPGDDPITPSIP